MSTTPYTWPETATLNLRELLAPTALLVIAVLLCIASIRDINPDNIGEIGLISILPPTAWLGLIAISAGFYLSLSTRLLKTPFAFLFLLVLVFFLHAIPAISYGTLRYSWAWKHIGIVDYIQRHGGVDRSAPFLAAYHNWPGFFVASAYLADLAGYKPLQIANVAKYFPFILNTCYAMVLYAIYSRLTRDKRLVWVSIWMFLVGNWVGQDYYSPQGVSFLMYLVLVALCIGPLENDPSIVAEPSGRMRRQVYRLVNLASRGYPARQGFENRWHKMAAAIAMLALAVGIVSTHQLTPVVMIVVLGGLAAIGRLDFGYVAFAALATAIWNLYFAAPFVADSIGQEVESFGSAFGHATDNLVDIVEVSKGQAIVSIASRGLTVAVAFLAAIGGIRRLIAGYVDGPAAVLALGPVAILFATSYGGEVIFRIFFFSLPFLAFFAAAAFFPVARPGSSIFSRMAATVVGAILVLAFLLANNGKDLQYRFTDDETKAAIWLYDHAPANTLLVEGARNYPSQFKNYENFTYLPLSNEDADTRRKVVANPAVVIGRWLSDPKWDAGYVIITRSQKAYVYSQAKMAKGSLDHIEQSLTKSPRFKIVYASRDSMIFSLNEAAPKGSE